MIWQLRAFLVEWKIKGARSRFFMGLGVLFLLIALVGVFLPVIPQVPFAIVSAYFFSKGSPSVHLWMRHNRYFGKPVREWEDFRVIRPKMKIIATVSMFAGAAISHYKFDLPVALTLDAIFAVAIAFVLTRKSKIFNIHI